MKNLTFCHFFELQKAVMGEFIFDMTNELQIDKFQLGWKLYSNTFPASYPAPDSDTGKCLKQTSKGAQPVEQGGATR